MARLSVETIDARIALKKRAITLVWQNRELLRSLPHPPQGSPRDGDTAADWADWNIRACGLRGMKKFVANLEALLASKAVSL